MIDYKNVDIQALMDIVKCAEARPDELFCMGSYARSTASASATHSCGTAGCLIGTWMMDNPDYARAGEWWDFKGESPRWPFLLKRLGLPLGIAMFLFTAHGRISGGISGGVSKNASGLTREEAIARLRKVIYYILHKREILGGGEETEKEAREAYERARRTGDIGVATMVREDIEDMAELVA